MIKYKVVLSDMEHAMLEQIIRCGKHASRKITRSRILLMSHAGYQDKAISGLTGASLSTIYRTKRYFVEHSLEDAINDDSRSGQPRKLDGNQEALLIATACTHPPEGCARWTLALLGERLMLPILPGWKIFLTCMQNQQTPGVLLSILTKQANSLSKISMNQNS